MSTKEKVLGKIRGPLEEIDKKPRLEMRYASRFAVDASRGVHGIW